VKVVESLAAVVGLLIVAAVTPGPNNFIVMERGLRTGFRGSLPPVAGIVAGSQLLLVVVWSGAGLLFAQAPALRAVLMAFGAGYLACLGLGVFRRGFKEETQGEARPQPFCSTAGLVLFQFLNPKSWVLVLTAVAATAQESGDVATLAALSALFLIITAPCLLLWAGLGASLTRFLASPVRSRWFDRIMGSLLVISSGLLLI
jgi:threonine/homoserine/homoserine lactone efflux protein